MKNKKKSSTRTSVEAKSSEKSKMESKKRKLKSPEQSRKPPKTHRIDDTPGAETEPEVPTCDLEEAGPWRNLRLILSIQNEKSAMRNVESAYNFVKSRVGKEGNDADQDDCETVKLSRLIVFLNDWVQSLLIPPPDKKNKVHGEEPLSEVIPKCLDFRCWEIFRFCMEESLKLHVSLSFSRNLLRAVTVIARHALSLLNDVSSCSKDSLFVGGEFELYSIVLDCVKLVFSSHAGLPNDNLDLWISTIKEVVELVHEVYNQNLDGSSAGVYVLTFSCLILEPFAKFLKLHPAQKNKFRDFVDKLLEPLLCLLGVLTPQVQGGHPAMNLLKQIQEVLSYGLFHPVHIDGFLSLHSTERYVTSHDGKPKDSKVMIKSYHRHFFDKLERIVADKRVPSLGGLGELFRLLVDRLEKQKGAPVMPEGTKTTEKAEGSRYSGDDLSGHLSRMLSGSSNTFLEKSHRSSNLNADARKSLFDFFVQIMEPLLLEINGYIQAELQVGPVLLDVHCTLQSINNLLAVFMYEKVYVKTEDTSEGACLNFLKKVFHMIMSFSSNLLRLSQPDIDEGKDVNMLTSLAKELLVALGYFLEIEYEVLGNDLISIWLMLFSYLAYGLSLEKTPDQCSLSSKIISNGCLLVNLYSNLRQVNNTIFALCKAVRLTLTRDADEETNYARFMSCSTSLPYEAYAKSVGMLLCSQDFKLAIHDAIKSIPVGQASGCVQQLTADILESLEWMKDRCSAADGREAAKLSARDCSLNGINLQAELLGKCLSEMYVLALESLTVTTGNSNLLGVSVKNLMAVIRSSMSSLVGLQQEGVIEFLIYVTGSISNNKKAGNIINFQEFGVSTNWVIVFFFRLYLSCRSLYRQAISLMPPESSMKMSAIMGDSFTAYSGKDWLERTDWTIDDYFSWIAQPSASLHVVIQSVSEFYLQYSTADWCPLIFILHVMAVQRLVDLNRQLKSYEYLLQSNNNLVEGTLIDDAGLSLHHKRIKKWGKRISVLKQEATGLTDFMMGYLSLVADSQQSTSGSDNAACSDIHAQALHEGHEWDLGVCTVNEKSLPTAIWWVLCENVDIWCIHAAKKKLKMFLSLLIHSSLPRVASVSGEIMKFKMSESDKLKKVTIQQISLELLSNFSLYEQRFVRRYLAKQFCSLLKKLVLQLFCHSSDGDVDFKSLPNWPEVLSALENSSMLVSGKKHEKFLVASHSSDELPTGNFKEREVHPSSIMKLTACQSLLNLLSRMPKGYSSSRSFSPCVTYILHLERLLLGSLLDSQGTCSQSHYKLFRLFVSCRKALKNLIMALCEDMGETSQSSLNSLFFGSSFPVSWLFKTVNVVVGLQWTSSGDVQVKEMIFSLMDHTSYVFLTLCKHQSSLAVDFLKNVEKPCKEQLKSHSSEDCAPWKNVLLVAESLKDWTQNSIISLKDALSNEKVGVSAVNAVDMNKLSSLVSCLNGFLWGLASAINHSEAENCYSKAKLANWKCEFVSNVNLCINTFAGFVTLVLHLLLVEDDQKLQSLCDTENLQNLASGNIILGVKDFLLKDRGTDMGVSSDKQDKISEVVEVDSSLSDIDDDSIDAGVNKGNVPSGDTNCAVSFLTDEDIIELRSIPLLRSLLKGDNLEAAFSLRQLFIASSAILRLNLHLNSTPLSSSLVPIFTGISQVLLSELAEIDTVPQPFSFVWLDGVLKYLEELGSHFPSTTATSSRNAYAKLINLQIRAIGKCISLQGKRATLASHETESSTKTLQGKMESSETSSLGSYCLDEFKTRLRMSFKVFIGNPSELHLLSAIQAIERALVGVGQGCTVSYEITTGSADGGKVSPVVAAGVDCLDLLLEFVAGRKRLNVVKRHIQSLIAALFNIILHLQSPLIFYGRLLRNKGSNDPDPGSVILMCVEVLTRVAGKHSIYQMDSWHVSQSLRIPGALFHNFHQLKGREAPSPSNFLAFSDNQGHDPASSESSHVVDRQFSIDLFAGCCRLLYTVLKHHKSDSERSVAILEGSVSALLHCLETPDTDSVVRNGYFVWQVQEGVKCACFLRRIYEEIRQQKDVFGRHCHKFLSTYIWVYSGHGPQKTGIRREIDEALKPGVYALIDACSADDLQYLHTAFGEGPCRSTLASLQHDYRQNFQYEGKV